MEFFSGAEVDVDGWAQDGKVAWMLVGDNKPARGQGCCEAGGVLLLCHALDFEADMRSFVHEQMGSHMQVLLFDGEPALSRHALQSSLSEVVADIDLVYPYKNCLFNVVASLEPACDLSNFDEETEMLCARQFNDTMHNMSQTPLGENFCLILDVIDDVENLLSESGRWFCHEALPHGNGHWYGLGHDGTRFVLLDANAGSYRIHVSSSTLTALCEEVAGLTWFNLAKASYQEALPTGAAHELTGSMMRPAAATSMDSSSLTSSLKTCLECSGAFQRSHTITARLYSVTGPKEVEHVTKRCMVPHCRMVYHYNYRWSDGQKLNTASDHQIRHIFVNSKTAFDVDFLEYHAALQFVVR
ncbi:hypothetical protein AK812_SmicGene1377 [Symbiodinium microadriaticum]|uniref:Uncharacterized protein n=1 Tax=Symbiodinium microadriaticum TaxID=2951 RepID=A0A1Q9F445_SYMMI|nr:hypothetical protein AK812_SmicGene1377 [Symbiodinium microadriaticum]